MVMSASAPVPRWPLFFRPSRRAGPARVMMAISPSVFSRLGWWLLLTTRHGSSTSRYHSRPIAHWSAWTSDLLRYLIGATPQPASISTSLLYHFVLKTFERK